MNGPETKVELREAYVEAMLDRLMNAYLESRQFPGLQAGEYTPKMVLRLCRAVVTEGYGE